MKTVGIIGAGAAGLCALKHVLSRGFTPVIWEHSSDIGGTWVYTPNVGVDEHGYPIHSSMYNSLKTNLPKEIMAFPDFPFKDGENSFIYHTDVLEYLNDYAKHFNMKSLIKFNHHVEWVEPLDLENRFTVWKVTVKDLVKGNVSTVNCDGIIVCNGHYSIPRYPDMQGFDSFKGLKMHSHTYRVPEPFRDLKVVVLGAAASGMDISLEVSQIAQKVYLSHNFPLPIPSELPANIHQVRGVKCAKENGFVLNDDSFIEADAIIFCTGYEYTFPFLSPSCGIVIEENQVKPLYKHLVNTTFPSMGLIGIPFQICPFPIFDIQVRYLLKVFVGDLLLPTKDVMDGETAQELSQKLAAGKPSRHYHKFGDMQWSYSDRLADIAAFDPYSPVLGKIYHDCHLMRRFSLTNYKKNKYTITGPDSFESSFGPIDSHSTLSI